MEEKLEKIPCPHCGKRLLGKSGVYTHIKAKHPGKPRKQFAGTNDDNESFAARAIQAQIDIACGLHTDDDWLLP